MDKKIKTLFKTIYLNDNLIAFLLVISLMSFFTAAFFPYSMEEEVNKRALYFGMAFASIYFCYPAEEIKFKEAGYFVRFGVRRKDYIINALLIENLISITFSVSTSIFAFILCDYSTFGYIGFEINKNMVGFIKLILVNHIYFSFVMSIGKIVFIIISIIVDKYISKWIKGFSGTAIIYLMGSLLFNMKINVDIIHVSQVYKIILALILVVVTNYLNYKAWLKRDVN
ncbi:hypothetical protein GCM10008905_09190 [Clostridium malenominatum]|uniref:ABC-2 family transporter protein n=1 Tax=Clostridium malenominatum TaxID=1539 RepID=A0ABN1IS61_9CLOT